MVRDSFKLPETVYEVLGGVKKRCLAMGMQVKKTEVLRAALANFHSLTDTALAEAIRKLEAIKKDRATKASK